MSAAHQPDPHNQLGFTFEEPKAPARRVWTVGELVSDIRSQIERGYCDLWVEGEISNLRSAPSGHIYFTLKDGESQLPVVLFRRQATLLRFTAEDGLQVLVRGKISVYEQRGQMQLIAEFMEPVGAGSLQIAFEQLKSRLQLEGLFDTQRKRPLPAFPHCVAIITSRTGAVIRDFLNIAGRRHAALHVLLYPATVQGASAAVEIAAGIEFFNRTKMADVIVIARGGGSLEDLAPFNSELLARTIAASELPVVSAVGHETDFTIADFVADLRAPTPSAAAELITEAQHKIADHVQLLMQRLHRACRYKLMQSHERLARVRVDATLAKLRGFFGRRQQRVDELRFRLEAAWRSQQSHSSEKVVALSTRLIRQEATQRLRLLRQRLISLGERLSRTAQTHAIARRMQVRGCEDRLQMLSPLAVLERGYAIVFDEAGHLVRNTAETSEGQTINTRLAQGTLKSRILERSA